MPQPLSPFAAVRLSSLRSLKTFCIAARRRSFKAAADELCLTPSAVSHQIRALEQRLQVKLFERRAGEMVVTDLGASLLADVDPLIAELDHVVARFARDVRSAGSRTAPTMK
ncbi:MAG TPA: LysR family transcriptional regulator [Gammaproteobacteria bacterium]